MMEPDEADFKSQLMSRLMDMEKEIKSLKASNARLRSRIKELDIMGFQSQLAALNKQIKEVTESHRASMSMIEQRIADNPLRIEIFGLLIWLDNIYKTTPALHDAVSSGISLVREVSAYLVGSIPTMNNPMGTILIEFEQRCRPKLKQLGFDSYYVT